MQKDERRAEKEERPARWQPVRRVFDRLALTVGPRTTFAGTTVPSHTSSHSNRARALSWTLPSIPDRSIPRTPTIRNLGCFVIHEHSRATAGCSPKNSINSVSRVDRANCDFFRRNQPAVKRKRMSLKTETCWENLYYCGNAILSLFAAASIIRIIMYAFP